MSRARWAAAVAARAAAYWTPTRTDELLRGKAVAVRPAEGAVLLRGLGIADDHGAIPPQRIGKYFQVNHMVATVAPAAVIAAPSSASKAALADAGAAGGLAALWQSPHLRREAAAHVTDLMRLLLLRAHGYHATALEFVPHEHTRKNTLLRATRGPGPDADAARQHAALVASTGGIELALAARLARRATGGASDVGAESDF